MSTFKYPKSVTGGGAPKHDTVEAVKAGIYAAESEGLPLTTGSIREFIAMPAGRVQQVLYYLGYRALEDTIKPYGRGHTWVWYKPETELIPAGPRFDNVFGTATGQYTGYKEWQDASIDDLSTIKLGQYDVRIQIRYKGKNA